MVSAVHTSAHPLVRHNLTRLRAATTSPWEFRTLVRDLTQLLFYEAIADVAVAAHTVQTPLAAHEGCAVAERVGLVPILRAGLGMVDPILDLFPSATVWHLGLYRDHDTLLPVTYYNKLPATLPLDLAIVLDPMLATGGSAVSVLDCLKTRGIRRLKFLGVIAAPEGVAALLRAHPDVPIHVAAVDSHLNEKGYMVPGLGDAGDRQFGT
ncbi:MAG: uracil phosphoribosyltransferase [Gemmataceae bacterium]